MNSSTDSLLREPIIIIGAPRSGTSFLSRLLSKHSQLAMLVEPRLTWKYGNDAKSDLLKSRDARPEVIEYIRGRFGDFVAKEGKSRLAEKTPSNALRLGFVDQIFPDAKYINIIRNGKDSALSIRSFWEKSSTGFSGVNPGRLSQRLKEIRPKQIPYYAREFGHRMIGGVFTKNGPAVWGPRLPGMAALAAELDPLEMACLQWRTCVELSCDYGRRLPSQRYLELRLEQLDSLAIERMLNFCGLGAEPAVEALYQDRFNQEKASARQKKMSKDENRILERWLQPTLEWLDYSDQ
ncbi:hypothetical protein DDZ13_10265 [Coraliomargarita sinensis]|uniref:Sulfotransferase n=2 Tax=Coraliomargarita sinensis TaxID=2174842 RepID=A0A317ZEK2_9BACT|nr:hypothetical protein DDZ13_10265 [Coraliomargarita sinensis]